MSGGNDISLIKTTPVDELGFPEQIPIPSVFRRCILLTIMFMFQAFLVNPLTGERGYKCKE